MQIIVQNESIGYSLGDVLNVSEDRGTRWIRKGYARAFEDAAPVADVKEEPIVLDIGDMVISLELKV